MTHRVQGLDGSRERRANRTVDGDCVVCSKLRHRFSDVSALLVSMSVASRVRLRGKKGARTAGTMICLEDGVSLADV